MIIAAYPVVMLWIGLTGSAHTDATDAGATDFRTWRGSNDGWPEGVGAICGVPGWMVAIYGGICLVVGGGVFPLISWRRWRRRVPACVVSVQSCCHDLWPNGRRKLIGDGRMHWAAWLPGNQIFQLEITRQTLALARLPSAWNGMQILVLSDFHFHGTPSRCWFEQVLSLVQEDPSPDVLCLLGDYVDSDAHREWIVPLLGQLQARWLKLAILGNHDKVHDPERIRSALRLANYQVLTPHWQVFRLRDEPLAVIGHEGPWLAGPTSNTGAPAAFRLVLSHTPDNFYWAVQQKVDLILCGHVHGGQIRLPVIGPIFVPSRYSRRFDEGIFQQGQTVMTICRGLSGREPLRYRCRPQVVRITLLCG
jgi:predicted MPP superfamily phosphohydrolase